MQRETLRDAGYALERQPTGPGTRTWNTSWETPHVLMMPCFEGKDMNDDR